jgi:hypothetical protein
MCKFALWMCKGGFFEGKWFLFWLEWAFILRQFFIFMCKF